MASALGRPKTAGVTSMEVVMLGVTAGLPAITAATTLAMPVRINVKIQ